MFNFWKRGWEQRYEDCCNAFVAHDYRRALEIGKGLARENHADKQIRFIVLISLQRLGYGAQALEIHREQLDDLDNANPFGPWEGQLRRLLFGESGLSEVLEKAADAKERAQAHYYVGARLLTLGDEAGARREFQACLATGGVCVEAEIARRELM